jgi:hypothetical protein
LQQEHHNLRKKMIGHDELAKEREIRIEKLKADMEQAK